MDSILLALILIPPFAACWGILIFLFKNQKQAPLFSVACMAVSAVASLVLLFNNLHSEAKEISSVWLSLGDREVVMGFFLDPLSLMMLAIVGVVSFLAQFYSLGYMKEDPDKPRYFAWMSLFTWSMLFFVVASNLLQAFIFWELVGLCSFLLIGFWYEKPAAAAAAKKAFYLTRLGDIGFLIAVLFILKLVGNLSFSNLNASAITGPYGEGMLLVLCLLIFCGVMGKSAQFPLHSWLPDAMEGPTPVSALIHSATMVAAGVYLLARTFPLFSGSDSAMHFILFISTLTMLMSATLGLIEKDIKRILAYSTVSQLGMMVMAIASGNSQAGMFHLLTHAFFKSMLFFTAGVFIHSLGSNNIFELAKRGARNQKVAWYGLLVGCFALSGFFPFSGFFSKEAIFSSLLNSSHPGYFYAAIVGAFLTAAYSFRLIFVLGLTPKEHQEHHPHEETTMNWPILLLMGITLGIGFFAGPIDHFLGGHADHSANFKLILTSLTVAALGVWVAFNDFGRQSKRGNQIGLFDRVPYFTHLLEKKYYVDIFIYFVFRKIYMGFSAILYWIDVNIINGAVNLTGRSVINLGRLATKVQAGLLQVYLGIGFIGIAIVIVVYLI